MARLKYKPTSPIPRIGFNVDPNQIFFDRKPVIDAVGQATAKAMGESGREIRRSSRRSMLYTTALSKQLQQKEAGTRKRMSKVKVSAPGQPPRAIRPHPFIKKYLFSKFDLRTKSAVIGPDGTKGGRTGAPRILEHGGLVKKKKNKRRRLRVIGGAGEIRIGGPTSRSTKEGITYGRLYTPRQVARANRFNEELYGPEYTGGGFQKAHRFMAPALKKEVPNMPKRWYASVSN